LQIRASWMIDRRARIANPRQQKYVYAISKFISGCNKTLRIIVIFFEKSLTKFEKYYGKNHT
jgi:hypothetical protein